MTYWQYPAVVMGLFVALMLVEWIMASKKHGEPQFSDKRRIRGLFGVGLVLAAIAWFIQWQLDD
ncbi:MAG: hypothetical protein ABIU95_04995 [Burkholderiales bacterium]